MKPRLRLKHPTGWFAAGREVADALALLSDAAFKLYVWLCLHADRSRGVLYATYEELATALGKSGDEALAAFQELILQGVCRRREDRSIEITDDFWPYHRETPHLPPESISAYVEAVKRIFLARACVQSSFSIADRKLAMRLQVEGVPIEHVERAIHMGCLLKYASLINHLGAGTPITSLYYFTSLLEQVRQPGISVGYWTHVTAKLEKVEREWLQSQAVPTASGTETN
jgi:hypothetical protein